MQNAQSAVFSNIFCSNNHFIQKRFHRRLCMGRADYYAKQLLHNNPPFHLIHTASLSKRTLVSLNPKRQKETAAHGGNRKRQLKFNYRTYSSVKHTIRICYHKIIANNCFKIYTYLEQSLLMRSKQYK